MARSWPSSGACQTKEADKLCTRAGTFASHMSIRDCLQKWRQIIYLLKIACFVLHCTLRPSTRSLLFIVEQHKHTKAHTHNHQLIDKLIHNRVTHTHSFWQIPPFGFLAHEPKLFAAYFRASLAQQFLRGSNLIKEDETLHICLNNNFN